MKRGAVLVIVVAALGLALNCGAQSQEPDATPQKTLRFASLEYPPYTSKELPGQGYVTDIVRTALTEAGYKVEIRFYPWARALELAKKGKVDGLFTVWHRKEREQWFHFSDALPANHVGFYKRKGAKVSYKSLADLAQYRIGVVRGYANPPAFEAADFPKKKLANSDEQNLKKLLAGRLDLVLIDRGVARHLLTTKFPEQATELEWIDPPLESLSQHLCLSKEAHKDRKLVDEFNAALVRIRKSGSLEEVLGKYGLEIKDY